MSCRGVLLASLSLVLLSSLLFCSRDRLKSCSCCGDGFTGGDESSSLWRSCWLLGGGVLSGGVSSASSRCCKLTAVVSCSCECWA